MKTITLDGYADSNRAVREMNEDELPSDFKKVRFSKYLNDLIGQNHRNLTIR